MAKLLNKDDMDVDDGEHEGEIVPKGREKERKEEKEALRRKEREAYLERKRQEFLNVLSSLIDIFDSYF